MSAFPIPLFPLFIFSSNVEFFGAMINLLPIISARDSKTLSAKHNNFMLTEKCLSKAVMFTYFRNHKVVIYLLTTNILIPRIYYASLILYEDNKHSGSKNEKFKETKSQGKQTKIA